MFFRKYVLTAAHCHDKTIKRFQIVEVVLGDYDLSIDPDCASCVDPQRFRISPQDVIQHEDWNLDKVVENANDIALVRLPRLAETVNENFEQTVQPACLGKILIACKSTSFLLSELY